MSRDAYAPVFTRANCPPLLAFMGIALTSAWYSCGQGIGPDTCRCCSRSSLFVLRKLAPASTVSRRAADTATNDDKRFGERASRSMTCPLRILGNYGPVANSNNL